MGMLERIWGEGNSIIASGLVPGKLDGSEDWR